MKADISCFESLQQRANDGMVSPMAVFNSTSVMTVDDSNFVLVENAADSVFVNNSGLLSKAANLFKKEAQPNILKDWAGWMRWYDKYSPVGLGSQAKGVKACLEGILGNKEAPSDMRNFAMKLISDVANECAAAIKAGRDKNKAWSAWNEAANKLEAIREIGTLGYAQGKWDGMSPKDYSYLK